MPTIISVIALCLFLFFYLTSKDNTPNVNANTNVNSNELQGIENTNIRREKVNSFTLMLNVGVFLILLSSVIFATSTWKVYSSEIKVVILGIETLLFLIFGLVLKHVFKITKSGNALTFISSILLPATFICAGYFKLFGEDFSLFGKYSDIFLSITFLVETIIQLIRKTFIKSNKYIIPLLSFLLGVFFLVKGISHDVLFSISLTSVLLLLINIFKESIFDETKEFKVFNFIAITLLTFVYFGFTMYQLFTKETFLLQRFSLIILLTSLSVNMITSFGRKNETLNILSLVYETTLVIWFAMFSGSLMSSSFVLIISGIVLYVIYYISNNKYISTTSLIISYLQGLLGIILICFDKTYILVAPISAFVYIILTLISSLKKDGLMVLNVIFEPIYLMMVAIGILIQPAIINSIKPIDVIMVINTCLIIGMIVATLLKNNFKNGYFILLLVGLFIQIACSYANVMYSVVALVINAILIMYTLISKDDFYTKTSFWVSLLFILNLMVGLYKYPFICALLIVVSLVTFILIFKDSIKKKYVFISLFCIPLSIVIDNLGIESSISSDIRILILALASLIFTRKVIDSKDEMGMCILELSLFTNFSYNIINDAFSLVFLVMLYLVVHVLKKSYEKSSKIYLNYLLFLIPIIFSRIGYGKYEALYMLAIIALLIINQIVYRLLFEKRHVVFEILHFVINVGFIMSLIGALGFSNLISALISMIFIVLLYLIYDNDKMKYFVISFVIYPVNLLLRYVSIINVEKIISVFIWIFR